ncbi:MAG: type 1 glutamine amidotransferase domain-containing protein [Gammaproteobacteria bacterium]
MKRILFSFFLLISIVFNVHAAESKDKVLVIMSNADTLELKDKKSVEVGFFLNEFAVPVQAIMDAGYDIVIATPQGKRPNMDKSSKDPAFFENDKKKMDEALQFANNVLNKQNIRKLSTVANENLGEYAGVFVPGGHAPMADLMIDANVGKILTYFHENEKPTAMICHGPIAVLSTLKDPQTFRNKLAENDEDAAEDLAEDWIYENYKMTIFSTKEEEEAEKNKLNGEVLFYPEKALEVAGANVKNEDPKENNVIEDKELITGQNPASDADLAKAFIKAMDKKAKQ